MRRSDDGRGGALSRRLRLCYEAATRTERRLAVAFTRERERACRNGVHNRFEELLACGRGEIVGSGNAQLPLPRC